MRNNSAELPTFGGRNVRLTHEQLSQKVEAVQQTIFAYEAQRRSTGARYRELQDLIRGLEKELEALRRQYTDTDINM